MRAAGGTSTGGGARMPLCRLAQLAGWRPVGLSLGALAQDEADQLGVFVRMVDDGGGGLAVAGCAAGLLVEGLERGWDVPVHYLQGGGGRGGGGQRGGSEKVQGGAGGGCRIG
eukprot:scaffold12265_cov116-Isochrysis_galbana.AAC.4